LAFLGRRIADKVQPIEPDNFYLRNMKRSAIQRHVEQGNLKYALNQLVAALAARGPAFEDLAQSARTLQSAFSNLRQTDNGGRLSSSEYQAESEKIAEKANKIIADWQDRQPEDVDSPGTTLRKWLIGLAVAGGVVALAGGAWFLFFQKKEDCSTFGKNKIQRVMILPFLRTGTVQTARREFDILDGLNDLFKKDSRLSLVAEADVNEAYDINLNYPNESQALEIANQCGVEMIVWGKMRNSSDTVEVRYRLLNPLSRKISSTGDSTVNNLLSMSDEGVWIEDYRTVIKLLYLVLAAQEGSAPMIAATLSEFPTASASSARVDSTNVVAAETWPTDTTTMFILADSHRALGKNREAMAIYDQILAEYPKNKTALRLRGTLAYQKKDYAAAARDYEALAPDPAKTDTLIQRVRADAYLKSGQPEKARRDLNQLRMKSKGGSKWIKMKQEEVADSTAAVQERVEKMERLARTKPQSTSVKLRAARAHLALGNDTEALGHAEKVLQAQPKNVQALEVAVEASVQKGDTQHAAELLERARRAGVDTKAVRFRPSVTPLLPSTKPPDQ
jgi:tetratricopeptide (TPR) repeat protein